MLFPLLTATWIFERASEWRPERVRHTARCVRQPSNTVGAFLLM